MNLFNVFDTVIFWRPDIRHGQRDERVAGDGGGDGHRGAVSRGPNDSVRPARVVVGASGARPAGFTASAAACLGARRATE